MTTKTTKTKTTTTNDKSEAYYFIQNLIADKEGLNKAKIEAYATIEGYSKKDIKEALNELGLSIPKANGFTYADTLSYLEEAPRTEREFYEKVLVDGTKNEARWISDRNKIRNTLNAIHVKYKVKFQEELASKELKAEVKEKAAAK